MEEAVRFGIGLRRQRRRRRGKEYGAGDAPIGTRSQRAGSRRLAVIAVALT